MTHPAAGSAGRAAHVSIFAAAAALMLGMSPAHALKEKSNEKTLIKSCEARLCTMLLQKNPTGDDLDCKLTKTWAQSIIQRGTANNTLQWGYGDARCSVQVHIPREAIVGALINHEYTFQVAPHTAECLIEQDGEPQIVKATLAPKITFKNGKAEKVWVNLRKVKGPTGIKASAWLAATLTDKVGLFHHNMIKSINKFISRHCPKHYSNAVRATAAPRAHERDVASKRNGTTRPPLDKKHGG